MARRCARSQRCSARPTAPPSPPPNPACCATSPTARRLLAGDAALTRLVAIGLAGRLFRGRAADHVSVSHDMTFAVATGEPGVCALILAGLDAGAQGTRTR